MPRRGSWDWAAGGAGVGLVVVVILMLTTFMVFMFGEVQALVRENECTRSLALDIADRTVYGVHAAEPGSYRPCHFD